LHLRLHYSTHRDVLRLPDLDVTVEVHAVGGDRDLVGGPLGVLLLAADLDRLLTAFLLLDLARGTARELLAGERVVRLSEVHGLRLLIFLTEDICDDFERDGLVVLVGHGLLDRPVDVVAGDLHRQLVGGPLALRRLLVRILNRVLLVLLIGFVLVLAEGQRGDDEHGQRDEHTRKHESLLRGGGGSGHRVQCTMTILTIAPAATARGASLDLAAGARFRQGQGRPGRSASRGAAARSARRRRRTPRHADRPAAPPRTTRTTPPARWCRPQAR